MYGLISHLDLDTSVDHVKFEFSNILYLDEEQVQEKLETLESFPLLADSIRSTYEVVKKKSAGGVDRYYTCVECNLTNDGQTVYDFSVAAVAYNADGEIIDGGRTNREDILAAGDSVKSSVELELDPDRIPEIDHIDIYVFANYQER